MPMSQIMPNGATGTVHTDQGDFWVNKDTKQLYGKVGQL